MWMLNAECVQTPGFQWRPFERLYFVSVQQRSLRGELHVVHKWHLCFNDKWGFVIACSLPLFLRKGSVQVLLFKGSRVGRWERESTRETMRERMSKREHERERTRWKEWEQEREQERERIRERERTRDWEWGNKQQSITQNKLPFALILDYVTYNNFYWHFVLTGISKCVITLYLMCNYFAMCNYSVKRNVECSILGSIVRTVLCP